MVIKEDLDQRPIDVAIQLAGGTQELLAKRLGCSQAAVSKWARGHPMNPIWAKRIEMAFPRNAAVKLGKFCPEFAPVSKGKARRSK